MQLQFLKMNGSGNDFVVLDARTQGANSAEQPLLTLSEAQIKSLASRANPATKGCDQLLILEPSTRADVFMRIYNADGSQVDACGNATRCVASLLYKEQNRLPVSIETNAAILQGLKKETSADGKDSIMVDMGAPVSDWQAIPLSMPSEQASAALQATFGLPAPYFVNMGNPHVVFLVETLPDDAAMAQLGTQIENSTHLFPQRVNVSFVDITTLRNKDMTISHTLYGKTWERGAGLTKACGTGACAMLAAVHQYNPCYTHLQLCFAHSGETVSVVLEANGHILLGGAVELEFEGVASL